MKAPFKMAIVPTSFVDRLHRQFQGERLRRLLVTHAPQVEICRRRATARTPPHRTTLSESLGQQLHRARHDGSDAAFLPADVEQAQAQASDGQLEHGWSSA